MLATPQLLPWYPEATSILDGKLTGSSGSSGASEAMSTRDNGFQTKPGTANGRWETIPPVVLRLGRLLVWVRERDSRALPPMMTVCFEAGCTVCASPGIPIAGCQGAGIPRCTFRRHICPPLRKREWGHSGLAGKPQASRLSPSSPGRVEVACRPEASRTRGLLAAVCGEARPAAQAGSRWGMRHFRVPDAGRRMWLVRDRFSAEALCNKEVLGASSVREIPPRLHLCERKS